MTHTLRDDFVRCRLRNSEVPSKSNPASMAALLPPPVIVRTIEQSNPASMAALLAT